MLLNADKKTDLELTVDFLSFCEHAQKIWAQKGKISYWSTSTTQMIELRLQNQRSKLDFSNVVKFKGNNLKLLSDRCSTGFTIKYAISMKRWKYLHA